MAKLDLTVEINDGSVLEALAEVRKKETELSRAISTLESRITGKFGDIIPTAAEVTEKSPAK